MDSNRSHKTLGSETVDFITYKTASSTNICTLESFPLSPHPIGVMEVGPDGYVAGEDS